MSRTVRNLRLFGKAVASNPSKGAKRISEKIAFLVSEEGLTQEQAAGKAFGMARHGSLGQAAKRAAGKGKRRRG